MAKSDKKGSIILHHSQYQAVEAIGLDYEEKGKLFSAIFEYSMNGSVKTELSARASAAFQFIKIRIDEDVAHYQEVCERRRKSGAMGGAPKGNTNAKKVDNDEATSVNSEEGSKKIDCASEVATKNNQNKQMVKKTTKTTKNNQNNLSDTDTDTDTDTDVTNVTDDKEEINSSMSFGDANDAQHSSDVEDVKVGMVKKDCDIDFKKLAEYFNSKLPSDGIPQIRSITQKRKAAILAREKEYGKEAIIQVIDNAATSQFLNGDNKQGWTASFDWLFCKTNFPKVLEGNYRNTPARQSGTALHNSENKDYSEGGW